MAELNREQHQTLSGSWSNNGFYDGFISSLGGMFIASKAEQTNGNHFTQFVNLLDSINRRLLNAFQGYVYKDSADGDDQFSVKPFTLQYRGVTGTFAGVLAQGPLVTGTNMIWADLTAVPTITIAFGAAWPGTPHLKLATITMPASGPWLPDAITSNVGSQAIAADGGGSGVLRADLAFDSTGSFDIGIVPAGSVVIPVSIVVHTAFDGAAPTIKVGDSGDDDSLFLVTDADLATPGVYAGQIAKHFTAQETISATYVANGSTVGGAAILLNQM